jgi:small subunit ribosomal protein S1
MRPQSNARPGDPEPVESDHGPHTLRVWRGTVVGSYGDDVFVELGPRMQGVISRRKFDTPPRIDDEFEFTLRGLEEGLWSLSLAVQAEKSLVTWEQMQPGSLVQARVIRVAPGGLEIKIGPLHAFMPKSQTGLSRDQKPDLLVGKVLTCEVIEVDPERARVTVSRRTVLQRERDSERQRAVDQLKPGQAVQGRITRIEDYGAFVAIGTSGKGVEGLLHVSNLSHSRIGHPNELVKLGQVLDLKVLAIRRGGKRIELGLKQMQQSPWRDLERTIYVGQVVEGVLTRIFEFGAFITLRPGIEGLVPASEAGLPRGQDMRSHFEPGDRVSARVLSFDLERERLSLSLVHRSGARIAPDEAANASTFEEILRARKDQRFSKRLGDVLKRVLDGPEPSTDSAGSAGSSGA